MIDALEVLQGEVLLQVVHVAQGRHLDLTAEAQGEVGNQVTEQEPAARIGMVIAWSATASQVVGAGVINPVSPDIALVPGGQTEKGLAGEIEIRAASRTALAQVVEVQVPVVAGEWSDTEKIEPVQSKPDLGTENLVVTGIDAP